MPEIVAQINDAAFEYAVAVEVQQPVAGARSEDADVVRAAAVPVADDGKVAGLTEGRDAEVAGAAFPHFDVAVQIENPLTGGRTKDADFRFPRSRPITDDGNIARKAETLFAKIGSLAFIEGFVAIEVEVPAVCAWTKDADALLAGAGPIADDRFIACLAEHERAGAELAAVERGVAVGIDIPRSRSPIENSRQTLQAAVPRTDDRHVALISEIRQTRIGIATVPGAVAVIEEPLAGAGAEDADHRRSIGGEIRCHRNACTESYGAAADAAATAAAPTQKGRACIGHRRQSDACAACRRHRATGAAVDPRRRAAYFSFAMLRHDEADALCSERRGRGFIAVHGYGAGSGSRARATPTGKSGSCRRRRRQSYRGAVRIGFRTIRAAANA